MQRDRAFRALRGSRGALRQAPERMGGAERHHGAPGASSWCRSRRPTRPTTTSSPTGCPTRCRAPRQAATTSSTACCGKRTTRDAPAAILGDADAPRPRLSARHRRQHRLSSSTSKGPRCASCRPTPRSSACRHRTPTARSVEAIAYRNDVTGGWRMALRLKRDRRREAGRTARVPARRQRRACRRHGATCCRRTDERGAGRSERRAATTVVARYLDALGTAAAARDALDAAAIAPAPARSPTSARGSSRCTSALADERRRPRQSRARFGRRANGARAHRAACRRRPRLAKARDALPTSPPLARTSMAPLHWQRGWWSRFRANGRRARRRSPDSPQARRDWHRPGCCGASLLVALIVVQTYVATDLMIAVLPYHGRQPLEIADPRAVRHPVRLGLRRLLDRDGRLPRARQRRRSLGDLAHAPTAMRRSLPDARTAIIMPICNEDVAARVRADCARPTNRWRAPATLTHFDFFVLSDSSRSRHPRRRDRGLVRLCRAVDRLRPRVLSLARSTASSARAATSPTSAGAGAAATATWSCSTPTAS